MQQTEWKKYVFTFLITSAIFGSAIYVNNYFNGKRIIEIQAIQNRIATDILSSETQFSLLSELSCKEVGTEILSKELSELARRIEYSEKNIGVDDKGVIELKKIYSLLEIKDYLLMKRISEQCGKKFMFALYFYSDLSRCEDCEKTGYVLTYLREKYPQLRVYSFDYHLDLSVIRTLISIFKIEDNLPAIVIGDRTLNGYYDRDALETILKEEYPKETSEAFASSTATSTRR